MLGGGDVPLAFPSEAVVSTENVPFLSLHIRKKRVTGQQVIGLCGIDSSLSSHSHWFILKRSHAESSIRWVFPSSLRRRPSAPCCIRAGNSGALKLGQGGDIFQVMMDAALGSRLLNEVGGESLDEILDSLRNAHNQSTAREGNSTINYKIKSTGVDELDDIISRHFQDTKIGGLSITGRYLPLAYKIISTLASPPSNKVIIVIDYEGGFQASRLTCSQCDLEHIYVLRLAENTRDQVRVIIANTEKYLLYDDGAKRSAGRELWGTVVLGNVGGGDITAGWKGWLRVDREQTRPFPPDITIEEALQQREERQVEVDNAGWQVSSPWGGFVFHDD